MTRNKLIRLASIPDSVLSGLESRDVALWLHSLPTTPFARDALVALLGLPWRLVFSEVQDPALYEALEGAASVDDPMIRKRGFIQIIDADPSRIELPQRCLPIFLPNGRSPQAASTEFESRLRRMTMLESIRRSGAREILVVSGGDSVVPVDLNALWSSGFRSFLTFISDSPDAETTLEAWLANETGIAAANLLHGEAGRSLDEILARYNAVFQSDRQVIRFRDASGGLHKLDVSAADEPERPILESYLLLEERDLAPLMPEELSEKDMVGFFQDSGTSWRPYAAGLPWSRDAKPLINLKACLKKLDASGPESNVVAYISSEPGAGGTTLARSLAWEVAREGYPVLLAKALPFAPDALPIVNFLTRIDHVARDSLDHQADPEDDLSGERSSMPDRVSRRRYETPWVIVFDSLHWQYRDGELARFRNELEKSGRPVCILVVTGTVLGLSFFNTSVFKKVAELNHSLDQEQARALGRHLNRFLRIYGKQRQDNQWDRFHQDHTVRYLEGTSAFWVTLSFWIQGQYDLSESIQHWIFRVFKEFAKERIVKEALLEIAAMSSERLPLPESLLPVSLGEWPVSFLLEDSRSDLSALGLVRIQANGERHWALVHDILGRLLINALFYDFSMREDLGFAEASDAEHLRFLLLQNISRKRELGERSYRSLGEDFSTAIFKIDPDHGRGSFVSFWREALAALDNMPRSLRDTSRVFRHHSAISRRRISKLNGNLYDVQDSDRLELLTAAVEDIKYALSYIDYSPGSEPNVNLLNSLANAYLDLAGLESSLGHSQDRIEELRLLANDATQMSYAESPSNSFVVETYVKNLIEGARNSSALATKNCIEALGVLYSALIANEATYRRSQLGGLADQALALLFEKTPESVGRVEPRNAIDVLVNSWRALVAKRDYPSGMALSDAPQENMADALDALSHPIGRGNMQVIRLTYDLLCASQAFAFKRQLELVEQLSVTDYRMAPQVRLEYAILLFQNGRSVEGDRIFRSLRQTWRQSEQFVQIPARLRWLLATDCSTLQTVKATTGSDYGHRAMARVQDFGNTLVPFRPEEFGFQDSRPGIRFSCAVSFGHNGPFLRPVTAHRAAAD